MMEYRFATASDIDALIKIRLEMLRLVNDLEDDYVFGEDFGIGVIGDGSQ